MPCIFVGVTCGKPPKPAAWHVSAWRWLKGLIWVAQAELYPIDGKPMPFSHTFLRWEDQGNASYNLVCHSTMKHGVDVEDEQRVLTERDVYREWRIEVSVEQFQRFVAWAWAEKGKGYSRKQLLGIGLIRITEWMANRPKIGPAVKRVVRWFGGEIPFRRNLFSNGDREHVCSETTVDGLRTNLPELFGPDSFKGKDADTIPPADVYGDLEWCERHEPRVTLNRKMAA